MNGEELKGYNCYYCLNKTARVPALDILHIPQPNIRLPGCKYYRTLTNCSDMQTRLGECVYVERIEDEKHKEILKQLDQSYHYKKLCSTQEPGEISSSVSADGRCCGPTDISRKRKNHYCRKDLRILRVERLFTGPKGQKISDDIGKLTLFTNDAVDEHSGKKFVFGFYYARPHETFCEPTRKFYKNELFCTPLYNTLPLDVVVARCLVMESGSFCRGRPRIPSYHEDDVYICDLRVDKNQRFFEKIGTKNRYPVCTEPYVFHQFTTRRKIKRDFSPFIFPTEKVCAEEDTPLDVIRARIQDGKRKEKVNKLNSLIEKISENTR